MQVRVHVANLEKGHKAVSQVFDDWTDALHPDGPVSIDMFPYQLACFCSVASCIPHLTPGCCLPM